MNLLRRTQKQPHQHQQPLSNRELEDNDDFIVEDEITFGRNLRARNFGKLVEDDDLSEYVKFRLWLARQIALSKYREKWS